MEHKWEEARDALEWKLFILDVDLGSVLYSHRNICVDMEKHKFVNLIQNNEVPTLADFS